MYKLWVVLNILGFVGFYLDCSSFLISVAGGVVAEN